MLSKKISKNVLKNMKKTFLRSPSAPILMASLMLTIPFNTAWAEQVTEENPTLVSPSEDNEGNLDYLVLQDYFITAERIPSHRLETPANVILITAEDIETNHYKSVSEALHHVTGVFDGIMNGSNRTLILVDGVRNSAWLPPMLMIDRIEIVKGGGSALYGTDAIGGVINVVTKKGTESKTVLDASVGSWKTRWYDVANEGETGKFHWFLAGGFHKQHPYKFAGDGSSTISDEISDKDEHEIGLRLDYDFTDRESFDLYFVNGKNKDGKYYKEAEDESGNTYEGSAKVNQIDIGYNFKKGTSTPGFLKYTNQYLNTKYTNYRVGESGGDGWLREQIINYQNGWELGKHKIIAGFEYDKTNMKSWYWDYNKVNVHNTAYYLQDTVSLTEKWTIIPGVRFDHNSAFGHKWSPKFAANYRSDEKTKIFASWGNVYRAPDLIELYASLYHYEGLNYDGADNLVYVFKGNPDLNPESGHTETIGIEHDFDENTNITASIFNTKIKNFILTSTKDAFTKDALGEDDEYFLTEYLNAPSQKYRGFELNFNKKIDDNWKFNVGYSFTHSKEKAIEDYNNGYSVPKNSFYLGVHYNNGPFKANLLGYAGNGHSNSDYVLDNYVVLDANASYDVTDWATIYLKYNNFTNKNYYANHSPGRFFMAGAQFKF